MQSRPKGWGEQIEADLRFLRISLSFLSVSGIVWFASQFGFGLPWAWAVVLGLVLGLVSAVAVHRWGDDAIYVLRSLAGLFR